MLKQLTLTALAATALALPLTTSATAQSGNTAGQGTPPYPPTREPITSSPNADRAIRRDLPRPTPSVDTNPNAGRGQSMYPPRVTPGQ